MKTLFATLMLICCFASALSATDSRNRIEQLLETADSLHGAGRTDSASVLGREALELARQSGDATMQVASLSSQGVYLRSLGRLDEAAANYDSALKIVTSGKFRDNPDDEAIEQIASLYVNLAVLNLDTQHKEQAMANARTAAEWIARSSDLSLRSTIYGVVGSIFTACGELGEATRYQALAYDDAMGAGDTEAAFRAAAYTMLIADRDGNKAVAEQWRTKCIEMLPQIDQLMARLVYFQAECSICLKNGDPQGALKWFDTILSQDGIDNLPFVKFDCYNNMHQTLADMGDFQRAYQTLQLSDRLRDSLWEIEKTESVRDLTIKYQAKETELALAQSEARRAHTMMWLLAAIGVLLAGTIGFIVYAGRQRRQRMERELEFGRMKAEVATQLTRQYIEGLENERRRMSLELHDGVCNDLLGIEMSIAAGQSTDVAAGLLEQCRQSVRRISHELMPPEFTYATLDEVLRFHVAKQADTHSGVNLEFVRHDTGQIDVSDNVALEVYRIVQEAVGNALKHSGADQITVELSCIDGKLQVTVTDNGQYSKGSGDGIGMETMRQRARSINGSLTVDNPETGGTRVTLVCQPD